MQLVQQGNFISYDRNSGILVFYNTSYGMEILHIRMFSVLLSRRFGGGMYQSKPTFISHIITHIGFCQNIKTASVGSPIATHRPWLPYDLAHYRKYTEVHVTTKGNNGF